MIDTLETLNRENTSVRNPDGFWINTSLFRSEALFYQKMDRERGKGFYCGDPWGSYAWKEYWKEQLKRCREGYSVGGVKITGHHYFYMNFCPIDLVEYGSDNKVVNKTRDFPHFWDGDYNFFWAKEIARYGISKKELENLKLIVSIDPEYLDGGYHIIVGKARRRGYSYKNASIVVNTYNHAKKTTCLIGAFDKKYLYPEGTMNMATKYMNFLNENTGWAKAREFVDKIDHKRASYKKTNERGISFETGYMSQIIAITYGDNADAARGKDAREVLLEEAGKFPNLQASIMATDDTLRAGKYMTGQMSVFGTSGDIEGSSQDLANIFYNPKPFRFLPFSNIWDENADKTFCGFFHGANWNMEGFYDENGNSNLKDAKEYELKHRAMMLKETSTSTAILQRMQENPISPSEAFLTISYNNFPVQELREQYNKVKRENLHKKLGQQGYLIREEKGNITFKPDLNGVLEPLWDYKPKTKNLNGCVVMYEAFIKGSPKGVYKIGYDPYRQETAAYSISLGATYVYKTVTSNSHQHNIIVAEYIGRPQNMDIYNRNLEMLAEYYNAEVMYENELTSVKSYFEKRKKLNLLAAQPDNLISSIIKKSRVDRVYGMHMADKIKEAGEKYINSWLLSVRDIDENGKEVLQIESIYSLGLLEELILYNRKGNFDRVIALMMVLFQVEADSTTLMPDERKRYYEKIKDDFKKLQLNLYKR